MVWNCLLWADEDDSFHQADELELHVQLHISCDSPQCAYIRWTWVLGNVSVPVEALLMQDRSSLFESEPQADATYSSKSRLRAGSRRLGEGDW
ncbi:hypothetical protein GMORB2_1742 [Geosmithia morbida]|uniref:Uncharacterized protein n=1 Tax=Geosmithia morbida TaxID=1094350 RepID=A0A9P4YSV1_9HYPO|nr:uncharacterized protein GMORB2_1742 [Geosmithia morbida]KAF4121902.1 hypothetical protein GMORB2_1742 [Geosmithia morbida]